MKTKVLNYLGFVATGVVVVSASIYFVRFLDSKFGKKAIAKAPAAAKAE